MIKKTGLLVFFSVVLFLAPLSAQGGSYLDTVYQTYETASDPVALLKNAIKEQFDIEIADESTNQWTENYLNAVKDVLSALPAEFRSATRMIFLDPSFAQFELKYNGYNEQYGIVQLGYGAIYPSVAYGRKFQEVYGRSPTDAEKIDRFKSILVRGLSYSFQQEKPEIAAAYRGIARTGDYPTKLYGPSAESYMVVAPGKGPEMIDMAFATAEYCANPANLQSKFESRFNFIKDNVMGGNSISGWDDKPLDSDNGNNDGGNNGGNNDNGGGTVENPGTRPPPEIPEGDYMPVVTEVDVGTAAASIPQNQRNAPDLLKSAIAELFGDLPKFFSTCTEAIAYVPTIDTEAAFSSESYVFITQNSWFMPSFVDLDDAARGNRFKQILLREMTLRFLFFHPEVTQKWKETFDSNQSTFEVYVDITQAVVAYYGAPAWLKQLNQPRYDFVKTEIMKEKEF